LLEVEEVRPGVTRLFGTVFFESGELKEFLKSKKRIEVKDHIQEGKRLALFISSEKGEWIWHPLGEGLRYSLLEFWRAEHQRQHFLFISTPLEERDRTLDHLRYIERFMPERAGASLKLAECSIHVSREEPFHRDSSFGLLDSTISHSTQEDLLCEEDKLFEETTSSLQFIVKISKILCFKYQLVLCPTGAGFKKNPTLWKQRSELLKKALESCGLDYQVDHAKKEASGPVLEVQVADSLGRYWMVSSLTLDCVDGKRAGLSRALIVRRAFSSVERIVALLLEQDNGVLKGERVDVEAFIRRLQSQREQEEQL
jgi:threonyl-tRNA synthetase